MSWDILEDTPYSMDLTDALEWQIEGLWEYILSAWGYRACQVSSTWLWWVVCFFKALKPLRGLRVMMSSINNGPHANQYMIGTHCNGL